LKLDRYGFYPAGGGRITAQIQPVAFLKPLHLGERGEMKAGRVIAIIANLPRHIAQREVDTATRILTWGPGSHAIESTHDSDSPGNVVMVEIGSSEVTEVFTAFGRIGLAAEKVAAAAANEAREYLSSKAVAGQHLTDQLLLPLALAGSGSFTAGQLNLHARTNMNVISQFLRVRFDTIERDHLTEVHIAGSIIRTDRPSS
jgi:RNA 3'-terminal phosphate cyclase (ATP)